jgi:tRNA(Ile)-lysidine synthase
MFIQNIHAHLKQQALLPLGSKVILGLSGGPDSVFLLHTLAPLHHQGMISLVAAHLDHQWRQESAQDRLFCQELCAQLNIPFVHTTMAALGLQNKANGSLEAYARTARRFFLEKVRSEHGADYIALAHHADDQKETFFIRLARGTSLSGLTGMKVKQGYYLRPLLHLCKEEIITYLQTHALAYKEDPTNNSHDFLRNRIRHSLIPFLTTIDQRFDNNLMTTIERLQEAELLLEQYTQDTFERIRIVDGSPIGINTQHFLALPIGLQYRILMHWFILVQLPCTPSNGLFNEIIRFLTNTTTGTHQIYPPWSIRKKKDKAYIVMINN